MREVVLTLIAFMLCVTGWAQNTRTASGVVYDKESKEVLPFVNITALPSGEGASSGIDGSFTIPLIEGSKAIQFSYLGYEVLEVPLDELGDSTLSIFLIPSGIKLGEANIKAKRKHKRVKDKKAIALQNKVIENKAKNRPTGYDQYSYTEYVNTEFSLYNFGEKLTSRKLLRPFKIIFSNIDTTASDKPYLPFLLYETLTDVQYSSDGNNEKRTLLASKFTGVENVSVSDIVAEISSEVNMYDDVIVLAQKPLISPFSSTGLATYRYYLIDSVVTDSSKAYQLNFSPKNSNMVGMRGYAWIDGKSYAIQSMEVSLPPEANINYVSDFTIYQEFKELEPGRWFLYADRLTSGFSPLPKRTAWSFFVDKRTYRDSIDIKTPPADSALSGESEVAHPKAFERDSSYWRKNRVEPLRSSQVRIDPIIDSIKNTKAYRNYSWLGTLGTTAFLRAGPVEFGRFYKFVSWNQIEGVRLRMGMRTNRRFSENMRFWFYGAYGLKDKDFKYYGSGKFILPEVRGKWQALELSAQEDFTFLGQDLEQQLVTHDNIVSSILRGGNELTRIMKIRNFNATYERDFTNRLSSFFSVAYKTYFQVDNVFDFETLSPQGVTEPVEAFSSFELGASFRYAFNQTLFNNGYVRTFLNVNKPVLTLDYTMGLPDVFESSYRFHKLKFTLFHRKASRAGITRYGVEAGKIFGDIPYPLMFLHVGNETFIFNRFAFNVMNEFEYANDEYVHGWFEHRFDGKIFNRIPGVNKLNLRSLVTFNALIGNVKESNEDIILFPSYMDELDNWYLQAGVGIENIFSMFRTDFMWRITQRDKPGVQRFAIKVAFTPGL